MSNAVQTPPMDELLETRTVGQAELLDAIVSSMAQGLLAVDANGRIVMTNQQFRKMLDFPDHLCAPGTHVLELARHAATQGHYGPGDPEFLARNRLLTAAASRASSNDYRAMSFTARGLSIKVTGRSMAGGGFVNTYTDVTESLAREASLWEAEARFRLLAENSSDVVCFNDITNTRLYVSPAVERLLGWTAEEFTGRNGLEFVHPDDHKILADAQRRIADGATESTALCRYGRRDDSWVWIEARARVIAGSRLGGTPAYVVVLREATDRVHAEQQLRCALEKLEQIAITDGLTGLANRRHFDQTLQGEWRRCSRRKLPLSVLMIDADHFKLFNDRYGHPAGDECLRAIATQVAAVARRPGDLAARYGGEEFVLLMPETDRDGALNVAMRLRALVQELGIVHEGSRATGVVTVSIGLAYCSPAERSGDLPNAEALMSAADGSLYDAKRDGRNRIAIAESCPRESLTLPTTA